MPAGRRSEIGFPQARPTFRTLSQIAAGMPNLNMSLQSWAPLLQIAGWIEIVFGTLVLVGLFTRPAAFILCGEMAVAYFRTHSPQNFWPLLNGGEITVLYCF